MQDQKKKLGSLFMVGIPGLTLDDSTLSLVEQRGIGHFIIFKRNVQSVDQLRGLCGDIRSACKEAGLGSPLISIDQEGGSVARLPEPFTQFPDARKLAEDAAAEELLKDFAHTCVRELLDVGVNMNLAPVLDVCPNNLDFFMERRVLGSTAAQVAHLGALVIQTMQREGLAACGKHFPGLGAAQLDPHEKLPLVDRTQGEIEELDLPPFLAAIHAQVAAIMTSHTIYQGLDPSQPATLSKKILTGLLREKMGYEGLVITDDLEMGAIENERSVADAALLSFLAGADMLLICHEHSKVQATYDILLGALERGQVSQERLALSSTRIARVAEKFAVQIKK